MARVGTAAARGFDPRSRRPEVRPPDLVDPPDGRLPAQTEEAKTRGAAAAEYGRAHYADGPEDVPHNCYGGTIPMLGAGYNNYYQIFQSPDNVGIYMEMMHDARITVFDLATGTLRFELL